MDDIGVPSLMFIEEDDQIITWYLRRSTDDKIRYVSSHSLREGMLSPSQGLTDGRYPWPEHVGLATVVDYR